MKMVSILGFACPMPPGPQMRTPPRKGALREGGRSGLSQVADYKAVCRGTGYYINISNELNLLQSQSCKERILLLWCP
jgi:hypothetical protein